MAEYKDVRKDEIKLQALNVLIVSTTEVETRAFHSVMPKVINKVIVGEYTYYIGRVGKYEVCNVQCHGMGSISPDSSAKTILAALKVWPHIKAVIMLGICFGFNEDQQDIGDVIVSKSIQNYETCRIGETEEIPRGVTYEADECLYNAFNNLAFSWEYIGIDGKKKELIFGAYVSGEKLVDNKKVRDSLHKKHPEAKAGEMEGNGMVMACKLAHVAWIMVKAICDFADGNKGEDKENRQKIAAAASANCCAAVLEQEMAFESLGICSCTTGIEKAAKTENGDVLFNSETIMTNDLQSYTIVPDALYVERAADQQLHRIVESMQRPGYVLVSRQMGKTNLLLRAKRKWENVKDLYVYVDMSTVEKTEQGCFEALIDTAINTHEELLSSVGERITKLRKKNDKKPVQAHNEELRVLLDAVQGKLVFILDEIDSLIGYYFSDNIFSQIRSVYFSRVNYPIFNKLTYVLSGVAEPTEIIRNPKISPFNIGEKIFLDDFSYEEYLEFICKAGLSGMGDEVIKQIYYWTGGNPRLTWDICYELQYKAEKSVAVVDALVKDLYLTDFDRAPVDAIRHIVKENIYIRDAVIQLLCNEDSQILSDKAKKELYLAGIINYKAKNVCVKNRIIKEALSGYWLQELLTEEKVSKVQLDRLMNWIKEQKG